MGLTILFVWELGAGLGHMMQMLPLARELVRRGHRVVVAVREPAEADEVFAGTGVCYTDAPHYHAGGRPPAFAVTRNFAHLLANVGWFGDRKLFSLMCCWANLFAWVRPDVVVFDHAPTALLASRGLPMKRVVMGSGFCVPPDVSPWPLLRPEFAAKVDRESVERDEQRLLARANRLLQHWGKKPLARLAELYAQADDTFLTTLPELEQFPGRREGRYWGPVLPDGGEAPRWPEAPGKRVFAYLKRFDGFDPLSAVLRESGRPTVLYVDGLGEAERKRMESSTLRVTSNRLDLRRAAAECDAAVLHAGQGATAAVLLAGKPILQIPLVLEQRLTAVATERLGASVTGPAAPERLEELERKLDALLTEPRYAEAAGRFGEKYAAFDPAGQAGRMVERVEELPGEAPARGKSGRKVFAG